MRSGIRFRRACGVPGVQEKGSAVPDGEHDAATRPATKAGRAHRKFSYRC